MHRRRIGWLLPILAVLAVLVITAADARAQVADFPVPGGWYFTQASIRQGPFFGYAVVDDATAPMWTEYRRLGGREVLGYPVSRRYFDQDGFLYQAFERYVLQWNPAQQRAVIANVFEQFTDAGLDEWLVAQGIPRPLPPGSGSFQEDARRRMSMLTESRFLGFYLLNMKTLKPFDFYEQAWEFHGLPQSGPERLQRIHPGSPAMWPFIVQRFQKTAFQLWLEDVPGMPPRGSVSIVTAGTLARTAGLVPITAALPDPPPHTTPWLIGTPSLQGAPIETGETRHFAIGGAGFLPGEVVRLTMAPDPEQVQEDPRLFTLTLLATATSDGSFTLEGDALPAIYTVTATGTTSGATVSDILVLR